MAAADLRVDDFLEAWRELDEERILSFFAEGAEMETPVLGEPLRSRERIGDWLMDALPSIRSIELVPLRVVEGGDFVAIHARVRGVYDTDVELAPGKVVPTEGKTFEVPVALFLTVNDEGKITHLARVSDTWVALQQLEVPPELLREIAGGVQTPAERAPQP